MYIYNKVGIKEESSEIVSEFVMAKTPWLNTLIARGGRYRFESGRYCQRFNTTLIKCNMVLIA